MLRGLEDRERGDKAAKWLQEDSSPGAGMRVGAGTFPTPVAWRERPSARAACLRLQNTPELELRQREPSHTGPVLRF